MSFYRLFIPILSTVFFVTASPSVAQAEEQSPSTTVAAQEVQTMSMQTTVKLERLPKPVPTNNFWDTLAQCETGGDWKNGGNWAGGLGIARSTWASFGGREFAPVPNRATREEQIVVANRIAIHGYQTKTRFLTLQDKPHNPYFQNAVGFSGWGALPCAGGRPHLIKFTESSILAQKYKWGQRGRVVKDLQEIVGAPLTARYDANTWAAHYSYLLVNRLDVSLAPRPKLKRPIIPLAESGKRCPEIASQALMAGFPDWSIDAISYIAWKESRCQADAVNPRDENGGSFGLMQVNNIWTRKLVRNEIIVSRDQLLGPKKNLEAAFYVWIESIKATGNAWRPWGIKTR